ncbi:hypothetical protein BHE74_00012796 [Ensete ventricosum]|nr:hypothetical protein GW17_00001627 [Ensete ventricosum]RWW78942.1 hypothetical protein BHE74_00012796 [Ensete ventricosum]RZS10662.1 hypothetical protein BHM03_00041914 [Ensete ventricosum]
MDTKHSAEMFKHFEKQDEVLMEAYRAMSHELHLLQVVEEMLMQKLYELMNITGLLKKVRLFIIYFPKFTTKIYC